MKFYVIAHRDALPSNAVFPCFILERDGWNDFEYHTLFTLKFYKDKMDHSVIGDVKIFSPGKKSTELDSEFTSLNENYCSLGQSREYYKHFLRKNKNFTRDVLWALKDVTIDYQRYLKFKDLEGFKKSLLRFSEAHAALRFGAGHLNPDANVYETEWGTHITLKNYSLEFTFQTLLEGADSPHSVRFYFDDNNLIPKRINVLIGRNGTGKTKYLIKLANSLSGWRPDDGTFDNKPTITKTFAISYSPFEDFEKPKKGAKDRRTFSYHYCGIRDDNDDINMASLLIRLEERIEIISKKPLKLRLLRQFLQSLFGQTISIEISARENFNRLSSGQRVLFFILSDILAYIQKDSLIIFDEPENHLHPNILSQLMLCLRNILDVYDSYAIIATHSPIILQDIPSECVRVLKRNGNITSCHNMPLETLGETLTTLTEEVYEISATQSNWTEVLKNVSERITYEEALRLFPNRLSLNSRMYLKSLYKQDNQ